jgi:apolipoprotein N-acyltransferase
MTTTNLHPSTSESTHPFTFVSAALIPHNRKRKFLFILTTAVLHFVAMAPVSQFYLAWVALVPMMLVVLTARTAKLAFFWAWMGGVISFLLALIYLVRVTIPGTIALSMYLGLYWALAGVLMRRVVIRFGSRPVFLWCFALPAIWTACEWLRGTLLTGLPFLYLGNTQSPFVAFCQIADLTGAYGVGFCVVMIDSIVLLLLCDRRRAVAPAITTLCIILAVVGYGVFRLWQAPQALSAGPRVMVVQPNHPLKRGLRSVTQQQSVEFHVNTTIDALTKNPDVDLVVWNETTMPPLNPEVRNEPGLGDAPFLNQVNTMIARIAQHGNVAILTGGYFVGGWQGEIGHRRATDIRNSAYLYDHTGEQIARYDKVHLVPFGEFIPFKFSLPWLFQTFLWLGPRSEDYTLTASDVSQFAPFQLHSSSGSSWRFVSPICFEDLDGPLMRRMIMSADGHKRADFAVNISNDGWFPWNEKAQHLQDASFRCIETRTPMARAVNTGISGFIDSCGRPHDLIGSGESGTRIAQLQLDSRVTGYSRFGDLFAIVCLVGSGLLTLLGMRRGKQR